MKGCDTVRCHPALNCRNVWQLTSSNYRGQSRRFYSPSLPAESNAGDQRIRRPRRASGPMLFAMRPSARLLARDLLLQVSGAHGRSPGLGRSDTPFTGPRTIRRGAGPPRHTPAMPPSQPVGRTRRYGELRSWCPYLRSAVSAGRSRGDMSTPQKRPPTRHYLLTTSDNRRSALSCDLNRLS